MANPLGNNGGPEKTKGRPKGARNRKTLARVEAIEASGLTPLDFMLQVMRDEANELEVRLDASKSAAPYVHARLAITQLDITSPQLLTPDERRSRVLELLGSNRVAEALGGGGAIPAEAETLDLLPGPGATET